MSNESIDREAITSALHVLGNGARIDPSAFGAIVRGYGDKNPQLVKALREAGMELGNSAPPPVCAPQTAAYCAPEAGDLVKGRWVYIGDWAVRSYLPRPVYLKAPPDDIIAPLYVACDFDRRGCCSPIGETAAEQKIHFIERNQGRTYGDGYAMGIAEAIVAGCYQEGDVFLGPMEFINGKNCEGREVRDVSLFSLLKKGTPALAGILREIQSRRPSWMFSGATWSHKRKCKYATQDCVSTLVYGVRLWDGYHTSFSEAGRTSLGVLPFCSFGIRRLER